MGKSSRSDTKISAEYGHAGNTIWHHGFGLFRQRDQIFITGGFANGSGPFNSAEVYDAELNKWSMIPTMFSRRSGHSCIAYHGSIYALGGYDGSNQLNSVESFDPKLDRWIEVSPMNKERFYGPSNRGRDYSHGRL